MDKANQLPDCRPQRVTRMKYGSPGGGLPTSVWIPVYCANCHKLGGHTPEENVNFIFYLCTPCWETHGAIANTLTVPAPWEQKD